MSRTKSTVAVLLLLVTTVVVIFGPQFINGQSDKKLLSETSHWNYSNQSAEKITDKQVALLYYNGEINTSLYPAFNEQNYDQTKIKDNVTAMLDVVFASNETVRSCIKEIVLENNVKYTQSGVLTMIDDRPVVLNFACAVVDIAYATFEFNFEQKTQTLISFSYYSAYPLDYTNSIKSDDLEAVFYDYYKNQLGFSDKRFVYQYEAEEEPDFKNYYVFFEIPQYLNEIDKEDVEYTF